VSNDLSLDLSTRFDLIALGECLVELIKRDDGAYDSGFAGDAFNTLFYASRLGLRTGFISAVGDDRFSSMITDGIEREGIDTSHLIRMKGKNNGLYVIETDERGEYSFDYWRENSAATETLLRSDLDDLVEYCAMSRYFLFTGITLAVMKGADRLETLLRRINGRTTIVFDTNYRDRLWSSPEAFKERMEDVMQFVDVFLPSMSDLETLYPDEDLEELLSRFVAGGTRTIAMTAGASGGAIFRNGELDMMPLADQIPDVVDATGAGDAFNAGFIAGIVHGESAEDAYALGQRVAGWVLQIHGAIGDDFIAPDAQ
jgi:2-dehydro-3-deoxygluconokinase